MGKQENQQNWIYVIDENFRIVYTNVNLKKSTHELKLGEHCYEMICKEDEQCKECPLRKENHGKSILFDHLHNEWANVVVSPIQWPNAGKCYLILCDGIAENKNDYFYNIAEQSEYNELLELNYLKDTYNIIFHSKRSKERKFQSFSISESIKEIAEKFVHPQDRERFYKFWQIDRIGKTEIPKEMYAPRHAEFRKLNADGKFVWVQQILIPTKQSKEDAMYVMSFYNVIDVPESVPHYDEVLDYTIFNRKNFYEHVAQLLEKLDGNSQYCIISIDIEKFKLFNEWYGRDAGDKLLLSISQCLMDMQDHKKGIAGCFGDDDFVFFMEYEEENIKALCDSIKRIIRKHSGKMNLLPSFGVYKITDKKESVYSMCDRAKLASSSVKGDYTTRIKMFDPRLLETLESELLLLSDIQEAFKKKEFTFVIQPKCNMRTGKIEGAEALARWYNADKGMISPGVFIPFLEKTGLVSALDTYIWEEVCRWQRSMLDRGRVTVPISVNVSRMDIISIDVPACFDNLIHTYHLDPKLIEIEITESAYADNTDTINEIVSQLHDLGFRVLMDDFGSAYSSLNMLKDISVDEIKIDMRFLSYNGENVSKATDILETVCNMGHILGLDIIAEGVETEEQKNLLINVGCYRGQGYYFYRPLAISDFEDIIEENISLEKDELRSEQNEIIYIKDLLNKNLLNENMLNNMLGAVAFYDVYDNQIHVARYNEQYAKLLGNQNTLAETSIHFGEQLYEEEHEKIFQMFVKAQENRHLGAETDIRRRRKDGTDMWISLRAFFLYQKDGHSLFYSTVRDVTEVHQNNMVLNFFNNDMPGGYYRHLNNPDGDFTHISQRFLDIFGYTREEIKEYFDDKFVNMVHPDDRQKVRYTMSAMEQTGGNYSNPCRMRSKNGYISILDQSRLVKYGEKEVFQGIVLCNLDYYMWLNDDVNNDEEGITTTLMPCGVFRSEVDGEHQFTYVSNSMLQMLGYSREKFENKFKNRVDNLVYKEDRDRVSNEIINQLEQSYFVACEYRIEMADGSLRWFYSRSRLKTDEKGKRWFYTCITDYDYLKEKYQIEEWQNLKYKSLLEIPGVLVYDYDPQTDRLTLEMSMEDGTRKTIVGEKYVENIKQHGFVHDDYVEKQKSILIEASHRPFNGTTEFKACFLKEEGYQWYRFRYISLADENGKVYRIVGNGENITAEKNISDGWQERAMKDSLTGLLNYESAKEMISIKIEKKQEGALFVIDVDNFKNVNDTLGHLSGDKLLIEIAKILKDVFRKDDIIARFGGDEFLVYVSGKVSQTAISKRISCFLERVNQIELKESIKLRCSIGISLNNDVTTFDVLFEQADVALYKSKHNGKNTYTFFHEMDERL